MIKKKLYPSSYALPIGNTVKTKYNGGCLRWLKFRSYLPDDYPGQKFPELNKAIGTLGEHRVELLLQERYPGSTLIIEEPFKQDFDEDAEVSGRCDFMLKCQDLIVEVKTTASSSRRTSIISKGNLPESYLGQLVTYLTAFDVTQGEVFVQYVHFTKDIGSLGFVDRVFKVLIDEETIYIDGNQCDYKVSDMLRFYELYYKALTTDIIPPRPIDDSPCYYCPFNSVCNDMNPPETPAEFKKMVSMIEPDYAKVTIKPPKLNVHNVRLKNPKK